MSSQGRERFEGVTLGGNISDYYSQSALEAWRHRPDIHARMVLVNDWSRIFCSNRSEDLGRGTNVSFFDLEPDDRDFIATLANYLVGELPGEAHD